eukprot:756113-Hanusia_phi.AAC.2
MVRTVGPCRRFACLRNRSSASLSLPFPSYSSIAYCTCVSRRISFPSTSYPLFASSFVSSSTPSPSQLSPPPSLPPLASLLPPRP